MSSKSFKSKHNTTKIEALLDWIDAFYDSSKTLVNKVKEVVDNYLMEKLPSWATKAEKPTYKADEVGALSSGGGTVEGDLQIEGCFKIKGDEYNYESTISHDTDGLNIVTDGDMWLTVASGKSINISSESLSVESGSVTLTSSLDDKMLLQQGSFSTEIWHDADGFNITCKEESYFAQLSVGASLAYFTCGIEAESFDQTSDERLKDIIAADCNLSVENIATAPLVHYKYKGSDKERLGSIAQYWQRVCPETVSEDKDGYLSMNYAEIALASAITLARKVKELEDEIKQLKNR